MNNIIEAINILVNGVNAAFSRGAYNMKETHDLHEAIEFIKNAISSQQQAQSNNFQQPTNNNGDVENYNKNETVEEK